MRWPAEQSIDFVLAHARLDAGKIVLGQHLPHFAQDFIGADDQHVVDDTLGGARILPDTRTISVFPLEVWLAHDLPYFFASTDTRLELVEAINVAGWQQRGD